MRIVEGEQPATRNLPSGAEPQRSSAGQHVVQFYDTDAFLFEVVAEFLDAGLRRSELCITIATAEHSEGFKRQLQKLGHDVDEAISDGLLMMLDAHECLGRFMLDGALDQDGIKRHFGAILRDREAGRLDQSSDIRAYGEMVDVLWHQGHDQAAHQLEDVWNELGRAHSFSLLCGYIMGHFGTASHGDGLARICNSHSHVVPASLSHEDQSDQHRREIVSLQQRTLALENEVADRKQLEAALRQALAEGKLAEERARTANRTKDEFLGRLGHELRDPLAPIAIATQLLRLRFGEVVGKECAVVERQVAHLSYLAQDLLDASRISAGGPIELNRQPLELSQLVAKSVEMVSPLLEERRHRFKLAVPVRGLCVDADEHRLTQAICSLLTNAARCTKPGGEVQLLAEREGHQVVMRVRDTGCGISPELLPLVFDLFVQGERDLARVPGDLGLSLAIVHNLILLHGGTVSAHSEGAGKGSEFVVRLPVSFVRTEHPAQSDLANSSIPARTRPDARRVLIVDDHRDAAELMMDALNFAGHNAAAALDGPSALAIAGVFQPEVVLVDLGLKVMNGYELARRLNELPVECRPKLVALAGYGQSSDRSASRAAGIVEHLVKPATLDQIESVLARVCEPEPPPRLSLV